MVEVWNNAAAVVSSHGGEQRGRRLRKLPAWEEGSGSGPKQKVCSAWGTLTSDPWPLTPEWVRTDTRRLMKVEDRVPLRGIRTDLWRLWTFFSSDVQLNFLSNQVTSAESWLAAASTRKGKVLFLYEWRLVVFLFVTETISELQNKNLLVESFNPSAPAFPLKYSN